MRITIVIDDADAAAATEAAQAISRAFVRSGGAGTPADGAAVDAPSSDAGATNVGEAPRFDFRGSAPSPAPSGNGSNPAPAPSPSPAPSPADPEGESAGAAPDIAGG